MERPEMMRRVVMPATADVKIIDEKQKSASSTKTPEIAMQNEKLISNKKDFSFDIKLGDCTHLRQSHS